MDGTLPFPLPATLSPKRVADKQAPRGQDPQGLAVMSFDVTDWVMGWQSIIPLSLSLLGKSENPESCSAHSSKSDVIAYSLQHSCTE